MTVGRSRVISVNREEDVVETLLDLFQAAKRRPSRYCRDLESFWDDLEKTIEDQLAELEGGGPAADKTAATLTRVRAAADQVMHDCNAELDNE